MTNQHASEDDRIVVGFDIETASPAPEDRQATLDAYAIGVTCIGAAMLNEGEIVSTAHWLTVEDEHYAPQMNRASLVGFCEFLDELRASGAVIASINGVSFDFRVLAAELMGTKWPYLLADMARNSVDPCLQALCELGWPIGMQAFADGFGLEGKAEGMDGLKAVESWASGDKAAQDGVLRYVIQDATTTAQIVHRMVQAEQFLWVSKKGKRMRRPATIAGTPMRPMLPTARECLSLTMPNTSWMDDPPQRQDFAGWLEEVIGGEQ